MSDHCPELSLSAVDSEDWLRPRRNTTVILGEVIEVDKEEQCVVVSDADRAGVRVPYDYLILATGATHSYFGHDEFRKYAPGLKNLADAVAVRNKILTAFEVAEAEEDPRKHRDLLTFVLAAPGRPAWRWRARSPFWYARRPAISRPASGVPRAVQSARECLRSVGLDLSDRTARITADPELQRTPASPRCRSSRRRTSSVAAGVVSLKPS